MEKTLLALLVAVCFFTSVEVLAKKGPFESAPPPPEGSSLIYMYRIKVPPGMRTPKIVVDSTEVSKLPNNAYTWFYVTPGSHSIKTKWGFMSDVPDLEIVADILPNQVYYLKMQGSVKSWGAGQIRTHTGIKEVPEAEALKELQRDLKYSPAEMQTAGADVPEPAKQTDAFSQAAAPPDGYALVYVYRPNSPPILHRTKIMVGNKTVMKLPNKNYSWFYLREGNRTVHTPTGGLFSKAKVQVPMTVQAGATYYLRLSGTKSQWGTADIYNTRLDPVDAGLATKELSKIKSYDPAEMQSVE
jgi:hypothetical protein